MYALHVAKKCVSADMTAQSSLQQKAIDERMCYQIKLQSARRFSRLIGH